MLQLDVGSAGDPQPATARFPFRLSSWPGEGRCLVATRDLRPEETVLVETAAVHGPASAAACVVCCWDGADGRCGGCGHVLCGDCEEEGGVYKNNSAHFISVNLSIPKNPIAYSELTRYTLYFFHFLQFYKRMNLTKH